MRSPFAMEGEAARRAWTQRNNGYERVERMQGNVGYLEVRGFAPEALSSPTAAAAMAFLQDTDALVIDLRRNGGGEPEAVRFLCSYFFGPEPVHLNTLVNREMNTRDEYWTLRELPGRRYLDKPVFVLVGARTFSGAEECAYNLQSLKRATIVGQTTGGGAHPVDRRNLGQGFSVMLPIARAENPVTKTNWEGVGVKPDVESAEDAALDQAWALALEAVAENEKDPEQRTALLELAAEKRGKSPR
jgi:C-terminal processing protease CtpA/Prc